MTRTIFLVAAVIAFCMALSPAAEAEKRVALVIGNADYTQISALRNPVNDARLMADTLREVGFDVVHAQNATRADMVRAIREFGRRLLDGGRDAVGLFYYAGHGVQALNSNFLLPLDSVVETEEDLELETVDAQWVLRQMERAGNKLNIIVLDACRNNPFTSTFRSATRGLRRITAPSGSLIAYSAAPGQVASDGDGVHSPYTAALANAIRQPGSELIRVFRQTRIAVEAQTSGSQTPWEEQSLRRDFYFLPGPAATTKPPVAEPDEEVVFWNSVKDSENAAEFEEFLRRFPNGTFSGLARIKLQDLKQEVAVGVFPEQPEPALDRFISIGTGGVTGVYYPAGGAICRLVNQRRKSHRILCSVESTGGSIFNINAIRAGDMEFGVAQSDWQYHAYHGTSRFESKGPFEKLRAVFSVHAEPLTLVARPDARIENIGDVRGKRLSIGNPGSGVRATWEVLEDALGWNRHSDLSIAMEYKTSEVVQALCGNKIDAFLATVGHPSWLAMEAADVCGARMVNVTGAAVDRLVERFPFYRHATIPGGIYPGNPNDVRSYGVGATVVTSADVPEQTVYELARAVLGNIETFRKLHPAFEILDPREMISDSLSAPLHDGALKAYRELGLM